MKNKKSNKIEIEICRRDYISNIKRNVLSILSIILTTLLIMLVFSLGKSYWDGITRRSVMMEGAIYDVQLPEPTQEQINAAKDLDEIENAGVTLKCAIMNKYNSLGSDEVRFYWCDKSAWEKQFVPAFEFLEGSYPTEANEIMLSNKVIKKLGIENPKIGMNLEKISYDALSDEGGTHEMDMILSGIFKDYSGEMKAFVSEDFSIQTGAKLTDLTQGLLNITFKNHIYSKRDILQLGVELRIGSQQVIYADLNLRDNFFKIMVGLFIFLLIILISGYLFIYNVSYIAIVRKIQFFGQLKTLGFKKQQINKIVMIQTMINLSLGIIGGITLGSAVSFVLVPIALKLMNSAILSVTIFQPLIIIISVIFSCIVVLICSCKIMIIIKKISPIAAMKFHMSISSKRKSSLGKGRMFDIIRKNMFRDKKQAIIIFSSLSLALSAFLTVNVLVEQNSAKNILNQEFSYDYRVLNQSMLTEMPENKISEKMVAKIKEINGVSQVWKISSAKVIIPYDESRLGGYYKKLYNSPVATGNYDEDIELYKIHPENNNFLGNLVGISEEEFEFINMKLGNTINRQDFLDGNIAIIKGAIGITPKEAIGKELIYQIPNSLREHTIKIVADFSKYKGPNYYAAGIAPDIIVSNHYFNNIFKEPVTELLDIIYTRPFNLILENKLNQVFKEKKDLITNSKMGDYVELKRTENQLRLIGLVLCTALAIISFVNYGNMIVAGIEARRVEFAIMRSIGMTPKQVIKMLTYEGLSYGIISILLAAMIGIPLSYGLFTVMDRYGTHFKIPIFSNLVVIMVVLVICFMIPIVIYKITPTKSIIEILREEN